MKLYIVLLLVPVLFCACTQRNLTYLSDLEDQAFLEHELVYTEEIANLAESKFQPGDMLSISVSSLNPEANTLFNKGEIIPASYTNGGSNAPASYKEGYLVDKEGFIDFPVLGRLKAGELSKSELKANLTAELHNYLKGPIVNIRHLNYKITVIGEVKNPATFAVPSERINIFEALGMAGDMTPFGKRENVLIIREEEGIRKITRVDLNRKEVLSSPYFYLRQNDVVYVEPDRARAEQASTTRSNVSMGLSVASLLVLILTRFL